MTDFFSDIFEYTQHSNKRLIEILHENPQLYGEKISLLACHTLNAHHIWNHRILGVAPALSVWQSLELVYLADINQENFEHTNEIIKNRKFSEKITYTNSKGQEYKNTVQEILFHVVNHSTYHRGQLISLLKNKGVEPLITDYIFHKR